MKSLYRHTSRLGVAALLVLAYSAPAAWGQGGGGGGERRARPVSAAQANAELFYEVLLGEFSASLGDPGAGYALVLDAARKSAHAELYRRAADIAIKGRSGDAALVAARAWKRALPQDRDANRYELEILLAMGRVVDSIEPLRQELSQSSVLGKTLALSTIPQLYARAPDKKMAAHFVEQALAQELANPETAAAALVAVGRLRLAAGDVSAAVEAARAAQQQEPQLADAAYLALDAMGPDAPLAEPIVRNYLQGLPVPAVHLAYARALAGNQRYSEALGQLDHAIRAEPGLAEAWLLQGSLQVEQRQYAAAQASLKTYIGLEQLVLPVEPQRRGMVQAWLLLAYVAEKQKDFAAAERWLQRIENSPDMFDVQTRRASVLAAQGRLGEARELLHQLPTSTPELQRVALMAEVQLLRANAQYQDAIVLLATAVAQDPQDGDLVYEQAILAEKMGDNAEMERLLRGLMLSHPEYHHAYNALGYSLAERNTQLDEARRLIQKALELAPNNPFITDSMGWLEFRSGNVAEALRLLKMAYLARPDPEIAAHLGEVQWQSGQKTQAIATWKEALQRDADNASLRETLKRLQVKL